MLLSGEVRNLTLQHMQGKCASIFSSLPKAPYKLIRRRMTKREQNFKICLGEDPLTKFEWPERIIQWTKSYLYVFKIIQKSKYLSRDRVRRFDSKLFCFSIAQDILVDTWKFTSYGEAWNNLYTDSKSRGWTRLVVKPYSRMSKGLIMGELVRGA